MKILIENGAEIDAQSKNGFTPLMTAVARGQDEAVVLLVRRGADILAKTPSGITPLRIAEEHGLNNLRDFLRGAAGVQR